MSTPVLDELRQPEDDAARLERPNVVAGLAGTTPANYSGVTEAARRHTERASEDAQASGWLPLGPRNVAGAIRCLAIRQSTPAERAQRLPVHLAAGSSGGGLWMSTNAGYSWKPAGLPEIVGPVGSVAWSATDRNVIYVGTGDVPIGYPGGSGFYKSDDGGATFKQLVDGSGGDGAARHYPKIAIDPSDAKLAWIASSTGLWRLQGSSFSAESIPGVAAGAAVTDVAVTPDPANANQLFLLAGVSGVGVAVGTFNRQNKRVAWQLTGATGPWPAAIGVVRVAWGLTAPVPTAHAIMEDRTLTGVAPNLTPISQPTPVFSSGNLGVAWASVAGALSPEPGTRIAWYALSLAVNPANTAMMFAGSTDLYRTTNGGAAWQRVMDWTRNDNGDRAQHADHFAIVFDMAGIPRLWNCNDGGISTSDNFGAAVVLAPPSGPVWRKRSYGISAAQLFDITSHPVFPGICGGGMQDNGSWVSYGGPSWFSVNGGDGGSMAFHPTSPYRLYSCSQVGVDRVDISTSAHSTLHNATHIDLPPPNNRYFPSQEGLAISPPGQFFLRAIAAHPTTPDLVLIGTRDALQYTSDGLTIATANTGVPAPPPNQDFTTVAFSPDGSDLWGGTNTGRIMMTTSVLPASGGGGAQPAWTARTTLTGPVTAIVVHRVNTSVVAACCSGSGGAQQLMLSHDKGANWFPIHTGLPNSSYLSLAWDPVDRRTLFVGTLSGVYVARDLPAVGSMAAGDVPRPDWKTFNRGLPLVPVTDLEVHPVTRTLRCATLGRGAFETSLGATPAAFAIPAVRLLIRGHAAEDGRTYAAANTLGGDPRLGINAPPPLGAVPPAPAANPAGPIDITRAIDIRVDSPRFTRSEAFPFGDAIDAVEYDETLVPDRALVGDQNIVYVQVQNRGGSAATNVDVHLYMADAGNPVAIPNIDASFNWPLTPGAGSPWQKADMITVGEIPPGEPVVVSFRVVPPLSITTNLVLLAIVTGGQDPVLAVPAGGAVAFVTGERRAALHVTAVDRDTIRIRDGVDDLGQGGAVAWGGRSPDIVVRQAQVAAGDLAATFFDLSDPHASDVARDGNNFVYVRVTNRTQQPVPRSVVRLFRVLRRSMTTAGPDGANWREVLPVAVLTNIPAGGSAMAEFPMPLNLAGDDPDPDSPTDGKGIILIAMANVTDAAGTTVLDPFPDFADVSDIDSFWRFFNGGALGKNAAMRALPFQP
jgi:hypothetical protein